MEYIFIYKKDTSYVEWEILLSKCTSGVEPTPTTVRYCVRNSSFRFSSIRFHETSNWVRARSYQQLIELILENQLEN